MASGKDKMKNIVIIGGGFGGVYAARGLLNILRHNPDIHITLINNTNYFLFVPMLHEVATGTLSPANIAEPLREILRGKNFTFIREKALSVDLNKKKVKTETKVLSYDYLVFATGSTANFFNTSGAEYCLTLKNDADARVLKNHLITSLEHYFCTHDETFSTFVVIGAGPTGIELCLEIKEFVNQILKSNANNHIKPHIILVHAGDVVLSQFPKLQKQAQRQLDKHEIEVLVNSLVTKVSKNSVVVGDKTIDAATIIWTAGVKPSPVVTVPKIVNERDFFVIDEFLRVRRYDTVFAVGDCAFCESNQLPMLAQVATTQGKHVAGNIALHLSGKKMKPFTYKVRGILLSLGKRKGAGVLFGIPIHGFFAWWLMRTIYLFKIIGTANKLKTAYDWTLDFFVKRDMTEV